MASTISGLGDDWKRGGRSALAGLTQAQGLSITGIQETIQNLRDWGAMAVYVTSFTSRRVAHSVKISSQRIVPYDTGELFDSAFIDTVAGAEESGLLSKFTVEGIGGNVEGTVNYSAFIPTIAPNFQLPGNVGGMRTFTKYVVGYSADHAAVVHENPFSREWNQDTNSPYPDRKRDHFLLHAYNMHRDAYSGAMYQGIAMTLKAIDARVSVSRRPAVAPGLSAGTGRPRLVKPGAK